MKKIKNSKQYDVDDMLWEMIRSRFLEDNGIQILDKKGEYFSDNFNNYFEDLCGLGDSTFDSNIEEIMDGDPAYEYEEAYEIHRFVIKNKKAFNLVKDKFGFDVKDEDEFNELPSFKIDPCNLMEGMEKFNWCAVPIDKQLS